MVRGETIDDISDLLKRVKDKGANFKAASSNI
jgi:hypothetical protein